MCQISPFRVILLKNIRSTTWTAAQIFTVCTMAIGQLQRSVHWPEYRARAAYGRVTATKHVSVPVYRLICPSCASETVSLPATMRWSISLTATSSSAFSGVRFSQYQTGKAHSKMRGDYGPLSMPPRSAVAPCIPKPGDEPRCLKQFPETSPRKQAANAGDLLPVAGTHALPLRLQFEVLPLQCRHRRKSNKI